MIMSLLALVQNLAKNWLEGGGGGGISVLHLHHNGNFVCVRQKRTISLQN